MKIKTFILTFLLMSCPFLFGQQWTVSDEVIGQYETPISVIAKVQIDGTTLQTGIVGAFIGDKCHGVGNITNSKLYLPCFVENETEVTVKIAGSNYTPSLLVKANDETGKTMGSFEAPVTIQSTSVAAIGGNKYPTLAAAISAATAGQTITFLADIDEEISFSKGLSFNGNGNKFSGTLTISENTNVSMENIKFDGDKVYPLQLKGVNLLSIKNCTVNNYNNFIYGRSNNTKVSIENVKANNINGYFVYLVSLNQVDITNVELKKVGYGFVVNGTGNKIININGIKMDEVGEPIFNTQQETNPATFSFKGENIFDGEYEQSEYEKLVLNDANATLTAPEGLNVTTNVEKSVVLYKNGTYKVKQLSGQVAYRADVTDKADREGIAILLKDVVAKNSLVVKVYNDETLMFTCTRRNIDDEGKVMFPVDGNTTANIVLWGKESGSWINEISVNPTVANVPNIVEIYADGLCVQRYTNPTGTILGDQLPKYLKLDCVYKAASITNAAGTETEYYMTLAEALADVKEGDVLELHDNATIAATINVTSNLTINGNGHTLTYTGSGASARAITVESTANGANLTVKNLTIDCTASYCQRGINYNTNGELTLEGVTVKGTNVTYALNLPGSSDNAKVVISNSSLTGNIALNVWGENATITANNTVFTSVDKTDVENYSAISLNNDGSTNANGTIVTINGGKIIALDENGDESYAVRNSTATGKVIISGTTEVVGKVVNPVAIVVYEGYSEFYSFTTLQAAIDKAIKTNGAVKLLTDVTSSEIITVNGAVVIDLNGKTVTSTAKKAFEVYANATIKNGQIIGASRCVDTRTKVELTLEKVTLVADKYNSFGNPQPLTIGGSEHGTKVNMTNVNISAAAGYGIITFVKTELTATNSTIGGYNALYVKPGSDNSTFNFVNSTLSGSTGNNDVEGNSFSTIALRANNVTVTVDANSTVKSSGNYHHAISLGGKFEDEETTSGNKVTIKGTIEGNIVSNKCINANTVKVNEDYITVLNTNGYATIEAEENLVTVCEAVAEINSKPYASLPAAFAAAETNETIKLLADIDLTTSTSNGAFEIAANRNLTLDLNGNDITAGTRKGYTSRTQYAFDNYANLTITGEGIITSRGIQNYGTLTINSENVKVVACDTDGGACVWGYENSRTNISAGTFENISGNCAIINTEGALNVTGGIFTQYGNGSTYAMILKGQAKAEFTNATIEGIHGVIAAIDNAEVTIVSGNYTLVGVTNQSDHNIYTDGNAEVIITGGIFRCNEKDAGGQTLYVDGTESSIEVSGGTFDEDVEAYCAEGYLAVGRAGNIWTVEEAEVQKRGLIKGWNWVSHYVIRNEVNDSEILEDLMTQVGENLLQVKNDIEGWTSGIGGDLETTTVTEMYKVQTNMMFDEISFTGAAVNPSKYPITLKEGWNYMGYPTSVKINVEDAFPDAVNGDWVKSQRLFAEFYNGTWYGPLLEMTSGEGYMYKNNGSSNTTVTFVANATRGAVEANITTDNNYWTVEATQFANNMSMVATLGADSENYELAAFVNGEVRGSARPIYVEALDAYMFFLTIHGEGVEEVTFKCYDIDTDTEYTLNERVVYSNDAILGSVREPYVLRGTVGMGEVSANEVAIYPNPTTTANEIMLSTTCDKVEVFNSLGVKVAEYQNVNTIEALETAGVYVIRVTNNDNVQNCRLVVK